MIDAEPSAGTFYRRASAFLGGSNQALGIRPEAAGGRGREASSLPFEFRAGFDHGGPSAAFGRNQNGLAQRRGGAEKSKRECVSNSASLRLCARYNSCWVQGLY
jgi:hypothetical protein